MLEKITKTLTFKERIVINSIGSLLMAISFIISISLSYLQSNWTALSFSLIGFTICLYTMLDNINLMNFILKINTDKEPVNLINTENVIRLRYRPNLNVIILNDSNEYLNPEFSYSHDMKYMYFTLPNGSYNFIIKYNSVIYKNIFNIENSLTINHNLF